MNVPNIAHANFILDLKSGARTRESLLPVHRSYTANDDEFELDNHPWTLIVHSLEPTDEKGSEVLLQIPF